MGKSIKEQIAMLDEQQREQLLATLDEDTLLQMARDEWWYTQRPEQVPPEGNWSIALFCAGRGAGKTKSGSEWLVQRALDYPYDASGFPTERLVMAFNISDARTTCVEGPSGVLRVMERRGIPYSYVKSPKPCIVFDESGAKIFFTGSDPDAPRGLNLADAWIDEPVKMLDPRAIWREGIRPALRANLPGDKPRAFVTTTPKPIPLLQEWLKDTTGRVAVMRGSTFDNAANLSQDVLIELASMYEGTILGKQELYGEMMEALDGPLFSYIDIDRGRVTIGPEKVVHRVVAVDPNLTGDEENGDLMGVIVACRDTEDHIYVIADESVHLTGKEAALHAWDVFARYQADALVVEDNLGKAWLAQVMTDAYNQKVRDGVFPSLTTPPLKRVHSNQGKKLRAEPVAMRYQQGRVHHIGRFDKLEEEMVGWDPLNAKISPDRLDALVHACRHLMEGERRKMRIIMPKSVTVSQDYGANVRW